MSGQWAAWAALMVAGLLALDTLANRVTGLARTVLVAVGLAGVAGAVLRALHVPPAVQVGVCAVVAITALLRVLRPAGGAR